MTDLAQLGLSLEATPMIAGLQAVDKALDATAARAEKLVATIKTATGQMAAAFKSVGAGGLSGQAQRQMADMVGGFQRANAQIRSLVADRVRQVTADALAGDKIQLNSALATGRAIMAEEKVRAREMAAIQAERSRQSMANLMQPILSTGSRGLPTAATSAFNEPAAPLFTASGIASVDKMRESLAKLRIEEAALHTARKEGTISHLEYARGMDAITKATNLAVAGNTRARGVFRQTASAIASATFEITGAIYGLGAAAAGLAAPAAFGFKLLSTLEQTKLGMSAILISMGEINGEAIKLPVALQVAAGITQRLQENALKYGVNIKALADTTRAIMAPGLGAGLNIQQIEKIALAGSIAVKTIGLDARQSVQEIRDLVAGGIQAASSTLATALGITDKVIKEWKKAGTLYENLMARLAGFQDTAILNAETLSGAWDIFVQKIQLAFANSEMFDLFKQKLIEVSNALGKVNQQTGKFEFDPGLVDNIKEYWTALKAVGVTLVEVGKVVVALTPYVIEFAKGWLLLKGYTLARGMAAGLLEIASSAITAASGISFARKELAAINTMKSPMVRVGVTLLAWEVGQTIGEWLYEKFANEIGGMFEPINRLIYNFGKSWGETLINGFEVALTGPLSFVINKVFGGAFTNYFAKLREAQAKFDAQAKAPVGSALLAKWGAAPASSWSKVDATGFITGKPGAGEAGGAGGKGPVDPQIAFMAALRKEAETLGMGEEALKRYEASKMKLTAANRRLADTYIATIFGFKKEQEAAKLANEEAQKAIEANDALVKSAEDKVAETEKSIKQLQFETSLLGMNTEERYRAIAANELSTNAYTEGNAALVERVALLKKEQEQQSRIASLLAGTQTAKTQDFMANIAAADTAFFRGDIGPGQYDEIIKNITDSSKEAVKELDTFAENAAKNIQDSMAEFLFNPFENGLKGMAQSFGSMLQKMIAEAVAADLARKLFGSLSGGTGSGLLGDALTGLGNILGFANGGAFSPGGVQAFAGGGIMGPTGGMLTQPTIFPMANGGIGVGGEAGVEAVMPLKRGADGKLGVAAGGGGSTNITVIVQGGQSAPDVRRAAGQGAREALNLLNGARRYG